MDVDLSEQSLSSRLSSVLRAAKLCHGVPVGRLATVPGSPGPSESAEDLDPSVAADGAIGADLGRGHNLVEFTRVCGDVPARGAGGAPRR